MGDILSIGTTGVRAYRQALGIVSENVANAHNPDYIRRDARLSELSAIGATSPLYHASINGMGVDVAGVDRSSDPFAEAQLRFALAQSGDAKVGVDWAARINDAISDPAGDVGTQLSALFSTATRLAADPNSAPLRAELIDTIGSVTQAFNTLGAHMAEYADGMNDAVTMAQDDLNHQLGALGDINKQLRMAAPNSSAQAQLLDQRDAMLRQLSGQLPTQISYGRYGEADLMIGSQSLVSGPSVASVSLSRVSDGALALFINGQPTPLPSSGALLGLDRASRHLGAVNADLNNLAADVVQQLNAWHNAGITTAGAPGGNVLAGTTAQSITVVPVAPAQLALANATGANGNLLALDSVRASSAMEARWTSLEHGVGLYRVRQTAQADAAAVMTERAQATCDAASGVDLDREAADMMRLQQAYDANARVLQVARETIQSILNIF